MAARVSGRVAHRLPGALLAAFALAALVELVSVAVDARTGQLLAKPLLMPLLAAYVAARGGPRLLVAALLLGWGGDVFLLSSADGSFLAGMGCFAAGHLCYLVLFGRRRTRAGQGLALGYGLALVVALALLWSGLPAELRVPVAVYSLLLAAMACRASALGPLAGAGGALFLLSDTLIATGVADRPQPPAADLWIMLTYIAAQALLTAGILRSRPRTHD
ncbi:lysoplasmalogenase [Streptomyces niveus]|uniref:lysoplasmalogenase n=1 Tax=Streptomyces niveus TaxID=193462 RepID=UPI003437E3B3